jgi:hypothetical protein
VRAELAATGELFEGYAPRMQKVHDENAAALQAIIDEHGFPTISLVGEDGTEAAWRIVQHAIAHPDFLERGLVLMEQAAELGQVNLQHIAFLQDRIHVYRELPQLYGTQFDWDENGEMSPYTVDDAAKVEERRAAIGMEPLAELVERVRAETKRNGGQPPDYETRRAEQRAWALRVGWISN